MIERRYTLADLLGMIARFRDPQRGCPWDIKQDNHSIVPHTLEEVCELIDAIDAEDHHHIREELGDVLLQVVFYARFAEEDGHFDFADVVHDLVFKLVRRHPHIYPDGRLDNSVLAAEPTEPPLDALEVRARWEQIKALERGAQSDSDEGGDGMPRELSALRRAWKLQKRQYSRPNRCAPDRIEILVAIRRSLDALEGDSETASHILGELLFSTVHLARLLKVEPERALRTACAEFLADGEPLEGVGEN